MTDCDTTSSNISGTPFTGSITQVGSNLEIGSVFQSAHGFTSGNVIRLNVATNGYTLAQANSAQNSEVCGVVNSVSGVNVFSYVVHGDINTTLFGPHGTIHGSTASEVFFLSSVTAGVMDSNPPSDAGTVLKSIIIRTPNLLDGSGITQEKGIVKNYIGNYLGGDTAVYMSGVNPIGSIHAFAGEESRIPAGWALCNGQPISYENYKPFSDAINGRYGRRDKLTFLVNTPESANYVQENSEGRWAKIISVDQGSNSIVVENEITNIETPNGSVRGGDGIVATRQTTPLTLPRYAVGDNLTFHTTRESDALGDPIKIDALLEESTLTPDLKNKFIMGAKANTDVSGLNETGGYDKIDLNNIANITGSNNQGLSDSTFTAISNMPPYITLNWIIRIGDSSYTALLNQLSLKTLSLTNIPITEPTIIGTVWNDGGNLKIKS